MCDSKIVVYQGDEDWSAIYVDGQLDSRSPADHYLVNERLLELLGVPVIHSDDFLLGRIAPDYKDVAQTLDEIEAFREASAIVEDEAAALEVEATKLLKRASELRKKTVN